ncbi:MAG: SMC-Scp complex subunit ScpB [Spirochaetes bacterium GWF1_31_7]|nr:MAG: SMC-Scp complex subunit ScpB [Spirochaetes bacterium GWE1_32_154]OHD46820.1 MAG: SMC-Scp complex subunit ScpB [Spirochaetes bacterium GWE2_31_10]OHD51207.1 MAG: SMC-Scp complex subunit ScpB [Spirochaetes bacterium GWF1_31_7]OHD79244.1 MAG: SMC-Scp complex subunit ScpB [Spirochaetes bacterium RIFOXYB1_FULL_32_8]HBD95653.1 SMC-Scp complex subunit ScpB [Spirochaetia bacterium]
MGLDRYSAIIEAVLFYESEVVSLEKLISITGLGKDKIYEIIEELKNKFSDDLHGVTILEVAGGFCMQIKKELLNDFKQIYSIKEKGRLTRSAMTVLSIIAYKQPVTKHEIEDIRGVSADNQVRLLLEKNLIEIVGRKEVLGKPLLYGTTQEFLKFFNLKNIEDLPTIHELKSDEFRPDDE